MQKNKVHMPSIVIHTECWGTSSLNFILLSPDFIQIIGVSVSSQWCLHTQGGEETGVSLREWPWPEVGYSTPLTNLTAQG